jgi:hypothetical protein
MLIQPEPYRDGGEATTEGITVELIREGLWVQRGGSPDEWNCVFVPACDLYRLLNREQLGS